MSQKSDLIEQLTHENRILRERLAAAELWISREISDMQWRQEREKMLQKVRWELVETEWEIFERIQKYFGHLTSYITPFNMDLLVESEINFFHVMKNKRTDGLVVTNAYQKVIEDIFEMYIIADFRNKYAKTRMKRAGNDLLEKTLYKVLKQNFRLSIGKIYQIFQKLMNSINHEGIMSLLNEYLITLPAHSILCDSDFWEEIEEAVDVWAFGEKRHTGKISYLEVQKLREIIMWNYDYPGLLLRILQHVTR